jgi:hypothetical protein
MVRGANILSAVGGRVALVILLKGINVGGHRTFRPSVIAARLRHLDAVNIGAAGTFVIRHPVSRRQLRAEVARGLPLETEVVICEGREIVKLTSRDFFAGYPARPDIIRFVSVMSRRSGAAPRLPVVLPSNSNWLLKVLARDGRFLVGVHRRQMKAIGCLTTLDRVFGVPITTRGWNTMTAIAKVLDRSIEPT